MTNEVNFSTLPPTCSTEGTLCIMERVWKLLLHTLQFVAISLLNSNEKTNDKLVLAAVVVNKIHCVNKFEITLYKMNTKK